MDLQEFSKSVLDRSNTVPVLVDFWAPWCGPCQVLGPTIEELAGEANGKWELVKINVDESQEVASSYSIMSIPTVMLFLSGKVKDQFAGALPKFQISKWLQERLPDKRRGALEAIQVKIESGLVEQGVAELETFVAENPDMEEARLWLARETVVEDPARSESLIEDIKIGHALYDKAEDIRNLIEFYNLEDGENATFSQLTSAREALSVKDFDRALRVLIDSMMADKSYSNEIARRVSIALFHQLGESHELTKKHRPRFSMALY